MAMQKMPFLCIEAFIVGVITMVFTGTASDGLLGYVGIFRYIFIMWSAATIKQLHIFKMSGGAGTEHVPTAPYLSYQHSLYLTKKVEKCSYFFYT